MTTIEHESYVQCNNRDASGYCKCEDDLDRQAADEAYARTAEEAEAGWIEYITEQES